MHYSADFIHLISVYILILIAPGLDFAAMLRESLLYGRGNGLMAALGIMCAVIIHCVYTILGLGLIIARSAWLFNLIKWAGIAYLLYIGGKALLARPQAAQRANSAAAAKEQSAGENEPRCPGGGMKIKEERGRQSSCPAAREDKSRRLWREIFNPPRRESCHKGQRQKPPPEAGDKETPEGGGRSGKQSFMAGFTCNLLNPKCILFFLSIFSALIAPNTPLEVKGLYALAMALCCGLWFFAVAFFLTVPKVTRLYQRLGRWIDKLTGAAFIALGLSLIFQKSQA